MLCNSRLVGAAPDVLDLGGLTTAPFLIVDDGKRQEAPWWPAPGKRPNLPSLKGVSEIEHFD
jgi:hypothetical protein